MSVLVDSSVWVDHFRHNNLALTQLLMADQALTHPMVIAELACGTPPAPRHQTLNYIALLRPCNQAGLREVMDFVERERLYGLDCGLVDMTLLASTLITSGAVLWTLDKRLSALAERYGVGYRVKGH